jgi:tyrosyl-tRNA synthetase
MGASDFLQVLKERGFIHGITHETSLKEHLKQGALSAYIGFDCTASSLHVGSLVQIMMLRWLQKTGHKPIVLMGGGTTRIGDPSGKDASRQLLTDEIIAQNMAGIKTIFSQFLDFEGENSAIMVNNADWLDQLSYINFLRDYGRHFSVNRMLTFDSVKLRLEREQTLSFLEFNYMIFQAYDFLELSRRYGCALQMGGSDQWGNIINGVELARRVDGVEVYGLTTPLLTTASGAKMGKTAAGAVWLNEEKLPTWDYWQFWRNTADADVGRFLKLFTELSLDEINRLEALEGAELNEAKKILATEATALARGQEAALKAQETAAQAFSAGHSASIEGLPKLNVSIDVEKELTLADVIVRLTFAPSKSEARRLIQGGGVKVDGVTITNEKALLKESIDHSKQTLTYHLSVGKKKQAIIALLPSL